MSFLQRLRRRAEASWRLLQARRAAGGPGPGSDLTVETFEYARVGPAALVRASGSWPEWVVGPVEMTLRVRAEDGGDQEVTALAETDPPTRLGWRVAFPLTAALVEHPEAAFSLEAPTGEIDLPRPIRRALHAGEADEWEADDAPSAREQALEGRVREAQAGLRWIQDQLHRERERRRLFERQVGSLEAKNELLKKELQGLSALALEASGLSLEHEPARTLQHH